MRLVEKLVGGAPRGTRGVPELVSAPLVSGPATAGESLAADPASWLNTPILSRARQWYVSATGTDEGAAIAGAVGATLLLDGQLEGQFIRVGEIASNAVGASLEAHSAWVGPIAAALSITGTPDPYAYVGQPYSFTPALSGGHAPYSVAVIGSLQDDFAVVNATTGEFAGTPTGAWVMSGLVLRVTDADGLIKDLGPFGIEAVSLVEKWHNYSFRHTLEGHADWAPAIVDPSDADNVTTPILSAGVAYPTTAADGVLQYGRSKGSAPNGSNIAKATAANNPLLAGFMTCSSAQVYTFDVPSAGPYQFRFAAGAATINSYEPHVILDGKADQIDDIITGSLRLWQASTVVSTGAFCVSPTDRGIWALSAGGGGTSGTVAPSGSGPTFADGGLTWTRTAITALALINNSNGSGSQVVDQNNAATAAASWPAQTPLEVTVTGSKGNALSLWTLGLGRPRQFGFRRLTAALQDIDLVDAGGVNLGQSPQVYAGEPGGNPIMRLAAATGRYLVSAFTLGGDLAPYFSVQQYDGALWLVSNTTRMPDTLAGARSLTITQTDPASSGSPHTTTYACSVISSQGRDTGVGVLGRVSTRTWLERKKVKDKTDGIWLGYTSGAFASDVLVTDGPALAAAMQALTPDGVSWYRIRLGAGTYTGNSGGGIDKDFGTGGLLIEPNAGDDPEFDFGFQSLRIHGLHVRGLKMPCNKLKTGVFFQWRFGDPGPTGINGGGRFNKLVIEGCRIGINFGTGNAETEWASKHSSLFYCSHGQSVAIINNVFDGMSTVHLAEGVRAMKFSGNFYRRVSGDIYGIGQSANWNSTIGVFADNDVWVEVSDEAGDRELDYPGMTNDAHQDLWQTRTWAQNMSNWWPNARPDDLTSATAPYWDVGNRCLNMEAPPPAVYEVVAVASSTAITGSSPGPSGSGSAIVDGDVTWKHVADYVHNNDLHLLMENNTFSIDNSISGIGGRQFLIDSNGYHDSKTNVVAINNVYGSRSSYGIGLAEGAIFAEFNTFAGANRLNASTVVNYPILRTESGDVHALHNVVQQASTAGAGARKVVQDELVLNWRSTAAAPTRPGDRLTGPFSQDGAGRWIYPTLLSDGSYTKPAFVAAMRGLLVATSGAAGIVT